MKKLEILFKNLLLRILLLFSRVRRSPSSPVFNENSLILIIRLNRIGDALITTPLISIIKKQLNCKIHVLASKNNAFVFANMPGINKTFVYPKGLSGFLATIELMRRHKYDAVIDAHDDISTTVTYLLAFSRAKNRFGLSKGNDAVYSKTIQRKNPVTTHVVERISQLATIFNINPEKENLGIRYVSSQNSIERISSLLTQYFPAEKFLIGINISAGSAARFWGTDNFHKLISFLKQYDVNVLILCSPHDSDKAEIISGGKEKIFYSGLFDEFAAMISKLDLLYTPDTAAVHLASAACVPVFGLYVKYQTNDMVWSPYKTDFDCIVTTEPNLDNISFIEVIDKFKPFLEKHLYERNTTV